jgi:hypothetical protein
MRIFPLDCCMLFRLFPHHSISEPCIFCSLQLSLMPGPFWEVADISWGGIAGADPSFLAGGGGIRRMEIEASAYTHKQSQS